MHPIIFDEFMTVCDSKSMAGNPPSKIGEEARAALEFQR
jgi:hypothetical protein